MDEENVGLHEFVEVKLKNKNCSYNRHVKLEVRIGDNLCIKTGEFNKYYRLTALYNFYAASEVDEASLHKA
ncbi:hypothetical protein ACFCTO_07230 [Megasphaera indica]